MAIILQKTSIVSAGRTDIDDVNAYPQIMGEWNLEVRQLSPGNFDGCIEYVEVAGMLLDVYG